MVLDVVALESRDGNVLNVFGLVADGLEVKADFVSNFVESVLRVVNVGIIHLVDSNNNLFDSHGESEQSMLLGGSISREPSLELVLSRSDHQNSSISLASPDNHVLEEVLVSRGVNDGVLSSLSLEGSEGAVDGDSSLLLLLSVVEQVGEVERGLLLDGGLLLHLLNGSLVVFSQFVEEVTSSGGLSRVHVTDDDDVDSLVRCLDFHAYFCYLD